MSTGSTTTAHRACDPGSTPTPTPDPSVATFRPQTGHSVAPRRPRRAHSLPMVSISPLAAHIAPTIGPRTGQRSAAPPRREQCHLIGREVTIFWPLKGQNAPMKRLNRRCAGCADTAAVHPLTSSRPRCAQAQPSRRPFLVPTDPASRPHSGHTVTSLGPGEWPRSRVSRPGTGLGNLAQTRCTLCCTAAAHMLRGAAAQCAVLAQRERGDHRRRVFSCSSRDVLHVLLRTLRSSPQRRRCAREISYPGKPYFSLEHPSALLRVLSFFSAAHGADAP
ncbi:hypothetical protein HEMA109418_06800 [Helcobacillus massiliensis]|uniref:Uncharacterized protein n=1 Tax=Helcobacillus massiliensis TaxID=521392 RepID=A0A839QRB1_9MICO|nr:hypothetical protein [Helcobacillus massiliensis]